MHSLLRAGKRPVRRERFRSSSTSGSVDRIHAMPRVSREACLTPPPRKAAGAFYFRSGQNGAVVLPPSPTDASPACPRGRRALSETRLRKQGHRLTSPSKTTRSYGRRLSVVLPSPGSSNRALCSMQSVKLFPSQTRASLVPNLQRFAVRRL